MAATAHLPLEVLSVGLQLTLALDLDRLWLLEQSHPRLLNAEERITCVVL